MTDPLLIAGTKLVSRLFVGTARYPNHQVMLDALAASGAEVVTASIRRVSLKGYAESLVDLLADRYRILPNTAGCVTARDAVLTAELAREALETNWVKLELIGDRELLYPDVEQLRACGRGVGAQRFYRIALLQRGPGRLPKLADVGCAAVMPLGSLIGSGMGIANPAAIELICKRSPVPVVLDAGIGTASDAALAMELGCDAVLIDFGNRPIPRSGTDGLGNARGGGGGSPGPPRRAHPEAALCRAVEPAARTDRRLTASASPSAGPAVDEYAA